MAAASRADKMADLAGPGIGDYTEVQRVLPSDYDSLLDPRETQQAIYAVKGYVEEHLCKELHLSMVQVPLIVETESGINDFLDRDGSRTPIAFHISNDRGQHPVNAQVVQAATKWKRMALRQFGFASGEGLLTDMRAVRKDYFLDHDHSAYVDQWDWEQAITAEDRTLEYWKGTVRKIWKVIVGAQRHVQRLFPALKDPRYQDLPREIEFMHAEKLLDLYPDLPRKQRETAVLQKHPALFILGIGWPLQDGLPHELRAADYDDWSTEVTAPDGRSVHGLNGDILVWNPVTRRRHELMSGGIRVDAESLRRQLTLSKQLSFLGFPYHQAILSGSIPLSVGGGIGQSRTQMLLLRKAHLGEVSVSVWPKILKEIGAAKNIHVLE
jgi:aspartate--ammonia ligase